MARATDNSSELYYDNGIGSLHEAAIDGEVDLIEQLLVRNRSSVDVRNQDGKTALLCAAEHGQLLAIKKLLEFNADPLDGCHKQHICCIHAAASGGYNDIIQVLLDAKVDVDLADHRGNTALIMAVVENHSRTVALLIKKGAEINDCNHAGFTPLEIAINEKNAVIVRLLLENGASVEKEGFGYNHLHIAAVADDAAVMDSLLVWATTEEINYKDESAATPLHRAAAVPDSQIVSRLLDYDVTDVTLVDRYGLTALHLCAESANAKGAGLLIAKGADVDAEDSSGNTPLCIAAMQGKMYFCSRSKIKNQNSHLKVVKALIEDGANVNHTNRCHNTPLILALERGCMKVAAVLIQRGADVQIMDSVDRNTPLHYAVRHNNADMVLTLVNRGAEVSTMNTERSKPQDLILEPDFNGCAIFHTLLLYGAAYRKQNHKMAISMFVRRFDQAFLILLAHGAALGELLNEEMAKLAWWQNKVALKLTEVKSVLSFIKQKSYENLLNGGSEKNEQKKAGFDVLRRDGMRCKLHMSSLFHMCVLSVREQLVVKSEGKSIWKNVLMLDVPNTVKDALLMMPFDQNQLLKQFRSRDANLC